MLGKHGSWSDCTDIPLSVVNIENRKRTNPLQWRGQFSPQLVEAYIQRLPFSNGLIFDPFCGSGTVLIEGMKLGHSVIGAEINSAAVILSNIYSAVLLNKAEKTTLCSQVIEWKEKMVIKLDEKKWDESSLRLIADSISTERECIKKYLQTILLMSSKKRGTARIRLQLGTVRIVKLIQELPYKKTGFEVKLSDARNTLIKSESIDFVFTSPPYINVFNYHQQYRPEVEALGYDVLRNAKSEVGSNRKHRANRLLTVIQYCVDMKEILDEVHRVLKKESLAVLVVGRESNVRKTSFSNSDIIKKICQECCQFEVISINERFFTNRFGQIIYEDIIHLKPNKSDLFDMKRSPRDIAREALERGLQNCIEEVKEDFVDALKRLDSVKSSPLMA